MYKMQGADGKTYGPVSVEEVRAWIAQGRANAQSLVAPEGGDENWVPLSSLPEFASLFHAPGSGPPQVPAYRPIKPAKTSGLAIASLVLGILGFCTSGLTALVGLILGIAALVKISRSQGQLGGQGLAIAGTCVSGFFTLLLPLMLAIAIPNFVKARATAQKNACVSNLHMINGAKELWALEKKKTATDVPSWDELVGPDKFIKTMPACPAGGTYTLNEVKSPPTCSTAGHGLPNRGYFKQ